MVTIKDIAERAGLSPSTVSRALSDNPIIKEETRKRVKRLAEQMGYERNELARGLKKGSIGAVGLIVPDITNPFFSEITLGVADAARERGYGVILYSTGGDLHGEREYGKLLKGKRINGLILTSAAAKDS